MPRTVSRVALGTRGIDLTLITIAAPAERRRVGDKGPVVVVAANVHGDECTGVGAVLRLLPLLEATLLRGAVHLYPTLNPEGLERRSRKVPEDDQDLNRLFPGDAAGSPSERLAHAVWMDVCAHNPDLVIDLHTDAPASIPYALLDRATNLRHGHRGAVEGSARTIAASSGLTVLHEYPEDRYSRYRLDRSLTGAVLNRLQVPAVTIEAGPRLYLDTAAVDTTAQAVLGMLHALGMVEAEALPHPTRMHGGPWRRDSGPRASSTGVLVPRVAPGRLLAKGDLVAEVRALSGALLEEIHAEAEGFVVSLAERTHVVAGVPVCTYALRE
ncbi:MAG: succinylglutamate desuccinylase/aspartoacylase family protein [Pseudomonadota bacterium]|nr:succinylglutamate desuccinylase/aspartoacylase family protein [Pseudomonadota bacterium]